MFLYARRKVCCRWLPHFLRACGRLRPASIHPGPWLPQRQGSGKLPTWLPSGNQTWLAGKSTNKMELFKGKPIISGRFSIATLDCRRVFLIWTYLDMVDMIWDECRLPSLAGNVQRWKMRKLQVLIGQASPRMFWTGFSHHSHELRTDCPSLLQLDADWYYRVLKHVWICVRAPPARMDWLQPWTHSLFFRF